MAVALGNRLERAIVLRPIRKSLSWLDRFRCRRLIGQELDAPKNLERIVGQIALASVFQVADIAMPA